MPNNQANIALVLSKVSLRFSGEKKSVLALKDISLSITNGSFVSIVGPSGAGKSTLMRTILGLMKPASGMIVRNFKRPAMVFQNYALFPWLSALNNVAFGLRMAGMSKEERNRIARTKLKEVGLENFDTRSPSELSGGQRQRVGLARALAIHPDLLILDEPFSNLDTITAEALKKDLLTIWRSYNLTVLMVNHLLPDAVELSDQIFLMNTHPGRIAKSIRIDLPRPRDPRSTPFYRQVDLLTEDIRSLI